MLRLPVIFTSAISIPAIPMLAAVTVATVLFAQSPAETGAAAQAKATPGKTPAASAPSRGSGAPKKEAKVRGVINVTPEREAAVMTFVQRNHPELADLLGYLKTSQPEEYDRAVKEIFRITERLALIKERDILQYQLEVAAWTAQSRVELLAAKIKMGASEGLTEQLRDALRSQNDAKLALLKHDRQKAADRAAKLDAEIARFEGDRDQLVEKQLQLLARAAGSGKAGKAGAKNAAKQAKKNTSPPDTKPTNEP